ncbi:hypothetical protein J14TS5_56640 [Paenibacillus lautus]|uniref:serine hydrolase domain-containing protein n=1 Tax=Paenibacillus lautus TaxID=1401 RepID=UPI001B16EA95|nr:serine hydrolase domain-containing protein [Paenibacillus lautus]GIP00579.1 hypothetical protein J14TS5_56640 [Paenibacillus lautus]
MSHETLTDFVQATAKKFDIPGVAVGVWMDGQEIYACHGVTSIDNPLPIDKDTLYLVGSVTKTYTATVLMHLVGSGLVELDAPVRQYIPELQLADEQAATEITVWNLLNHTSGLDWGLIVDTGEGDDALAAYVEKMDKLKQIAPPGVRASYSQAGYNLIGRIIEKVTGLTYEKAIISFVLDPLGLSHSFFARDDVMTRRFAVGHNLGNNERLSVARLWRQSRGDNPGGGLVSSVSDLVRWSQFHLHEGKSADFTYILPMELLHRMKDPTIALKGTNHDALGICWFLRDVDGICTIGHSGSANGQFSELLIVPERNFAIVALSNAGPNGIPFNQAVVRWALEEYLGVVDRDPEPIPYSETRAQEIIGIYEIEAQIITIRTDGTKMTLEAGIKPEIRAAADSEMPPDYPPADIGMLPGNGDEFIIINGGFQGKRGFFTRDESGTVNGLDLGGQLFKQTSKPK